MASLPDDLSCHQNLHSTVMGVTPLSAWAAQGSMQACYGPHVAPWLVPANILHPAWNDPNLESSTIGVHLTQLNQKLIAWLRAV